MTRNRMNTRGWMAAGLIATLAGGALALGPEGAKKTETQQVNLGGPQVENAGAPDKERAEREGPRLMEYMAATRSLRQAGADLQITAEQREIIGAAVREHRAAMAEFTALNKDVIQALRAQAGIPEREERGGLGDRRGEEREGQRGGQRRGPRNGQAENEMDQPGKTGQSTDDGTTEGRGRAVQAPTPEQVEARDLLRELMATGPDEQAVVEKIQSVLTVDQNLAIESAIIENRERRKTEGARERRQRGPETTDRVRGQRAGRRGQQEEVESDI